MPITEKGLEKAKQMIASLKRLREIKAENGEPKIRSLEIVFKSGRVCVFSNEQPAADFPLYGKQQATLDQMAADAFDVHEQMLLEKLKAMGIDPDASEEEE